MARKDKPVQHPEYEKSPMDRRTFIRNAGIAGAISAGGGYLAFAPENALLSRKDESGFRSVPEFEPFQLKDYRVKKPNGMAHDIGIARVLDEREGKYGRFSEDQQRKLLKSAIDAIGGIKHYVKKGDVVLLKPNVAFDRDFNLAATSNPVMVGQMVRLLLEEARASEVRVTDNPIESPQDCFRKTGIRKAVEEAGGRIFLPDNQSFERLSVPGAEFVNHLSILSRPFEGVDKLIGMAPVKDHVLCQASISIKNWVGLFGGQRNSFHKVIHEYLSEVATLFKPTFTVIDGTQVLHDMGPTGGDERYVRRGNVAIAGLDQLAMDAWAFEHCLGRGKVYPEYFQLAEQKGAGRIDWTGRVLETNA